MKVKSDHRSKFLGMKKPEKIRASTVFEPVTSAIPARCSTNWPLKPHIGSEVNLLSSYVPVRMWDDAKYIWNNSYSNYGGRWKWRMIIKVNSLEWRSPRKSGLQRDSNPWPPRYRCDALPTELWSHTLGATSICWVHIFPCGEVMWSL